jgi:uncharacterized membrane protein
MKRDRASVLWQLKVVGLFMIAVSIVAGLLTTFVLPGNDYLSSALLLLLGLLFVCGVLTLVAALLTTYRGAIARSMMLPVIIIGRLIGR